MRDGLEAMFVAYALVFERDAGFAVAMSVSAWMYALVLVESARIPSNLANVPELRSLLLRTPWRAALPVFLALRHSARRAVFLVVVHSKNVRRGFQASRFRFTPCGGAFRSGCSERRWWCCWKFNRKPCLLRVRKRKGENFGGKPRFTCRRT